MVITLKNKCKIGSCAIILSPCVENETVLQRYVALADGVFNQFTAAVQIQFAHNVFAVTGDTQKNHDHPNFSA
jgi:hypothetical protein